MRKVFAVIILFFIPAALSFAGTLTPRLQQELGGLPGNASVSIIVTLKNSLNLANFRSANPGLAVAALRAKLIADLKTTAGLNNAPVLKVLAARGIDVTPLWIINGLAADVPVSLVNFIASQPQVDTIDLNAVTTLAAPLPATQAPSEWNLNLLKASTVWSLGYTGQGAVVASMDTGVDAQHADLVPSYRGGNNSWYDPYGQHATPYDGNGHGTGVMSIMVGSNTGGTNIGVAPGAKWIAAKIFNDAGTGTVLAFHNAFQWMLDPDGNPSTDDAPDVVNGSWSFTAPNVCDTTFFSDVAVLKAAGIAMVYAAGNSGPSPATSVSPGNYTNAYSVGAVDQNVAIGSFSSRGPSACGGLVFPHVVAPGVNVKMAALTSGGVFPNAYIYGVGTSMAAPHVAGIMALLRGALSTVTVTEKETAINTTALDILNPGVDSDSGYGLVDAQGSYYALNVDTDGDGVVDGLDNCVLVANPSQYDADGDGYGNLCDADLNNSGGVVNTADYTLFRQAYLTVNPVADLNGSGGVVNTADLTLFRQLYLKPPGPSGLVR